MSDYEIMPAAREDLREIEEYIASDNPDMAQAVIDDFRTATKRLAEMPYLGHRRSDVPDPRYRFYCVYSWLIVYDPATKPLQILRAVHGHRDLPETLD